MIVDFFRHGSGLSKGCLDYLLGEDRKRDYAEVLSGDVELTAQLIDSSPFSKKYTSGCLSFYEHDLSDPDKQKIMQNFERCLFPGLDQDQYQILWVQHQDKINQDTEQTRLELNFVIPNVELITGKRLQPFYAPVDLDRVDLFKKITNAEYELHNPDDPNNQQLLINKKNLPRDVQEFKEKLHQHIYQAVVDGKLADRQELVQWLESNEIKVTRQTPKSISIENPYEDAKRPIRLDGEIYEQGFRATGQYRQKVQQRIAEYRGTTGDRYRANVTDYQSQLEHKSEYHRNRYPTVQREDFREHSAQLTADREAIRAVSSLATIQIESFKANERANTDSRESSTEHENRKEIELFEYGADFSSSYINYSRYCARIYGEKQIQRDPNPKYDDGRETSESESPEPIRGQFEYQYVQEFIQQQTTPMRPDQQEGRGMAGWIYDSNGVLENDGTRDTVITDYRRTTATIIATTRAATEATASFRYDANQDYSSLVSAVRDNQERSARLIANTRVVSNNTEAISRSTANYNSVHQADRGQNKENGTGYNNQRASTRGNLNDTVLCLIASSHSSTKLDRNLRDIEENINKMKYIKMEIEKSQSKKDRGFDFEM